MFKDRLRATRIFRGFTQQKTADSIDVPLRHYQKYEGGNIEPDLSTLVKLSDLLNVPSDFLLGRDDYLKSLGVSVDVSLECPPRRPKSQRNLQSLHIQSSDSASK
ncbi:helix-turn-helix transcriptional regulator [Lachnospiraceae bacterium KGMB03038]|nr:helix-turn-helix transcriptional regulator [Lachnospiraceae bacterium KGMB03038]